MIIAYNANKDISKLMVFVSLLLDDCSIHARFLNQVDFLAVQNATRDIIYNKEIAYLELILIIALNMIPKIIKILVFNVNKAFMFKINSNAFLE